MTELEYLEQLDGIWVWYRAEREKALSVRTASFVHEVTAPIWAVAQERIRALDDQRQAEGYAQRPTEHLLREKP